MGKNSNYVRKPRDYYPTPIAAVVPLIPHLPASFTYCEPCAGDGRLLRHIDTLTESRAICTLASDIEPQDDGIEQIDALELIVPANTEYVITNPPWERSKASGYLLHSLITHFSDQCPTWFLFDGDWVHTLQSSELVASRLCKIVSIGRVKWIEDSAGTGKDNACWYLFDVKKSGPTEFYGR